MIKHKMIELAPRYNSDMRKWGARPSNVVHDELTWHVPTEVGYDPAFQKYVNDHLFEPAGGKFLVPFCWDAGYSTTDWAQAAGDDTEFDENGDYVGGKLDMSEIENTFSVCK